MSGLDKLAWTKLNPLLDQLLDASDSERSAILHGLEDTDAESAAALCSLLGRADDVARENFLGCTPFGQDPAVALSGKQVGSYKLERPLGSGGMGSVWLACRNDGRFEGHVAIKFLNLALMGHVGLERFRREGSALARLTHPNVARLLDAGVTDASQPYLALEYVDGESLDSFCDRGALDIRKRVRLFLDVLAAVAHAHSKLILHRDLKSSNILVTSDGCVKLVDFGIAKLLDEADRRAQPSALTQLGGRPLTPEYAAPELIEGGELTMATDVYSLGVVLYVLLCGEHPTAASTATPISNLIATLEQAPMRPSARALRSDFAQARSRAATPAQLARSLRGDLDNILARALKKRASERYPTVDAFADDLRRYLAGEPVLARADALGYRTWKFLLRNRAPIALVAATVLSLATGLVVSVEQTARATELAQLAQREQRRADSQRDFALRQLARSEAISGVNSFLMREASAHGTVLAGNGLLARAEDIAERQHVDEPENRLEMLIGIGSNYAHRDDDAHALRVLDKAYRLSASVSDSALRAKAACALAGALVGTGEFERAERLLARAESELPSGPEYVSDRIDCLQRGSSVAGARGDGALALDRLMQAERLLARAQPPSALRQARLLGDLAATYQLAGLPREANERFTQAWTQLVALGRGRSETASMLLIDWGSTLAQLGRALESEQVLRHALEMEASGSPDADIRPRLLNMLARVLIDQQRLGEAESFVAKAHALALRKGNGRLLGQNLLLRAELDRERGDLAAAATAVDEAEALYRGLLPVGHIVYAQVAMQRALLARAHGDLEHALSAADLAVANADAGGLGPQYLAPYLTQRSDIRLAQGQGLLALVDARRAFAIAEWLLEPALASSHSGLAALALARAHRIEGHSDAARAACASAFTMLDQSLGPAHPATRASQLGCMP